MWITLTLLSLVSRIPSGITLFHACIPNSQFRVNGRMCVCDPLGRWSEASCEPARRFACTPGQNIWENCNHCICQLNGRFTCVNMCADNAKLNYITKAINVSSLWCIPFVSYYINCNLCVCPASGKMIASRCTVDAMCPFRGTTDYIAAIKTNICIPKVMYVFPCLRCLCSEEGTFSMRQCVEICPNTAIANELRRCKPRKFFKRSCNICFCPNNGIVNEHLCTKSQCGIEVYQTLSSLRNKSRTCLRQMFTGPKCFYCLCGQNGKPNENACLEMDCVAIDSLKYGVEMAQCTLGEMVPYCMDCFCLRNGLTNPKYCTAMCSHQHKIALLESVIKDSYLNRHIVDMKNIPDVEADLCAQNSIYTEHGKYCLCPESGETDLNLCTSVLKTITDTQNKINLRDSTINIDFDAKCDPGTFVQFDCNTCYCSKTGHIDPKWCTYDDCQRKRYVMENNRINYKPTDRTITECVAGSMSKERCNYCICPESGIYKDRVCTKNSCRGVQNTQNELICEPLTYYAVDCNICYCPKNGIKNIAKCTKQTCEKNVLRSETCTPGRLFSNECNVCVCPPNGNKADRICTEHICVDSDTAWKKIFKLSQSLPSYEVDDTRKLELCFPGEEFEVGCKVCFCSEMGLRAYATCTEMFCFDSINAERALDPLLRTRRKDECRTEDIDEILSKSKDCEPGSIYVTRCRECICPFEGNNHFCRPLPEEAYCEQSLITETTTMGKDGNPTAPNVIHSHNHTVWSCDTPGIVLDQCFICDCVDGLIIKEHCFHSDNSNCTHTTPTFLLSNYTLS